MSNNNQILIQYNFKADDGLNFTYNIRLDRDSLEFIYPEGSDQTREWTKLSHCQCSNCPLDESTHPHCPLAVGLAVFVEDFKEDPSYKEVKVTVKTEERVYFKNANLQDGLYSIMGIVMATSGCPNMDPLRPMARFHLPFSTMEETIVRVLSFYLLRQYFNHRRGDEADFDLIGLDEMYDKINKVNQGTLKRIRSLSKKDANTNGLIILDAFTTVLTSAISNNFEKLEKYFPAPLNSQLK
ncbi:MAG: hypothetical protein KDD50_11895 [Bdellovibrionales bacterium]|nr:hypothetical protein [Bdellovibrionales bacterium]